MTTEHPTGRYMKLIKGGHRWCSQPLKMQARGSELSQGRTTEVAEPVAVGSAHADISPIGRYFNPQALKENAIHNQDSTSGV